MLHSAAIEKYIVEPTTTLLECLQILNSLEHKVIFVAQNERLIASITDGDIRRHMLHHRDVQGTAIDIGNTDPKSLLLSESNTAQLFMRQNSIQAVPLLGKEGCIQAIIFDDALVGNQSDVPVIINGGGKGTRLRPFTDILPKPLIPVGDRTISERIIDQFKKHGFQSFHMIINHMGDMIEYYFDHLRDSKGKEYGISFIREKASLGTIGGVKLMESQIHSTFILTNCDILVQDNLQAILTYHREEGNSLTIISCMKKFSIPYGIIDTDSRGIITRIREKPNLSFMTSTGMYVMEPSVLAHLDGDPMDAPDFIKLCMKMGLKVGVFPIPENSWFDMGQLDELERMRSAVQQR